MDNDELTINGRLVAVTGKAEVDHAEIWFAYRTTGGDEATATTRTDHSGAFALSIPPDRLDRAVVGASIEGVKPVDLKPDGQRLDTGDLILMVDDIVPAHLRYGGA